MSSAQPGTVIGVFLGLESAAYEFHASIVVPYLFEAAPLVGEFVLVDNISEYIIARIMEYIPRGELTTFMGEKWLADVALIPDEIGQDIKTRKIAYRVKLKLLGRIDKRTQQFSPGIARIPHITSAVLRPNHEYVNIICNKALESQSQGIPLGTFWLDSQVELRFDIRQMIAKRSFIFARAGYGKSNLMKIIATNWQPDYGALFIFDPEGEYAITDQKKRPGILDQVPAVLISNRRNLSTKVSNNLYNSLQFNLKKFPPRFIIPILVPAEKHETIFFKKLMSLSDSQWHQLVDLFYREKWRASNMEITAILKESDEAEIGKEDESCGPISNNLISPIQHLHDPNSKLLEILELSAKRHFPVILDISLLDSHTALQFSSLIVSYFFTENQRKFLGDTADDELYRIVFVVEEAQSVIGTSASIGKFVELAKEGRKYQLGGIFITQQPGSISPDILSQGDNFFTFHMISRNDLKALQNANAHFSDDIITQILNEPIPGKAYMWTSAQPFVLPLQVVNFETVVQPNNAAAVQSHQNLLGDLLTTVKTQDQLADSIYTKFLDICQSLNISFKNDAQIEQQKNNITRTLYARLDDSEKTYLMERNRIQCGPVDKKPFAVHYFYFNDLLERARSTIS